MKYVLFVYDDGDGWHDHPSEDKRTLHNADEYQAMDLGAATLIAHYRLRAPRLTTTLSLDGDRIVRTEGPQRGTRALRAIFSSKATTPRRCSMWPDGSQLSGWGAASRSGL